MLGFIRLLHLDLTSLIPFGQNVQHHDQFDHQKCFRSVWSSDISRLDRQVLNENLQVFWLHLVSYRAQTTHTLEMATINLWIS